MKNDYVIILENMLLIFHFLLILTLVSLKVRHMSIFYNYLLDVYNAVCQTERRNSDIITHYLQKRRNILLSQAGEKMNQPVQHY